MSLRQICPAFAVTCIAFACWASPAAAQTRTQSSGGAGGSLFGSGGSLFGGGTGGAGVGAGGGQLQTFGAAANNPFTINQPGGSGGFVGRDSSDTGGLFEALNSTNNNFLDQVQRRFFSRDRGRGNQGNDARPPIRVKLQLGFEPTPTPGATAQTLGRINTMLAERGFGSAQVASTEAGLALIGSVETEADRRMLSRLVSLEPGVGLVQNDLSIGAQ
ncbi:MAG: BON domain-containing protein [Planctomycetota bacterium]